MGFRKHLQSKEVPPSVQPVLEKYFDRFPDKLPGLPPHRKIKCEIKLEAGHSPPARTPYRLSYGQLDELKRQLDSYLEKEHIRPSISPYAAPVLFVQKADGTQRMCIDFTGLNKITVRDKFPIPHPEELLSRLHGAKFFSSLDLRQYFHQTRIREGDEKKTAFVISRTPEEHIEHINRVLSLLREHQLYVKKLGITPKYIPGRANIVADALSRNPPAARQLVPSSAGVFRMGRAQRLPVRPRPLPEAVPVSIQPIGSSGAEYADLPDLGPQIEESQTLVREGDGQQSRVGMELQSLTVSATQSQAFLDTCRRGYSADPFFHPVLQHLSQQHLPAPTLDFALRLRGMSLRAGLLYFEGNRLCVLRSQQGTVMAGVHSPPHAAYFGMGKTYRKVTSLYYWPKMWRSVASFVRACDRCQRSKGPTTAHPGLLQPLPIPSRPWESTCIDRLTDLLPSGDEGFDAILVVLCRLIKAVVLIPTHSTAGAEETTQIYRQHVSCKKGFQRHIVCDRDPRFVARFW
uniref:Uncharacterized protein n=1 Tax=Chromera velia CCMP2878 TaxID=1169474 RepID=A0A0G4FJI4_9ALVE|eukprot:Cvel_17308.t1-p1 / transcript=Cvel_17308.t1 / gene=Cvel_17308 / organism=Chromera_velia_CCMP2878 / gene_product=Transposon Ty3-I Gag-Pol polyprotein, putative / transcript_product=Transposon Ty3-I Gag-Pol polyprotein, putative / location=Cvel_scaffold1374:34265-36454(+) / protein_length=516 / sequence_SO=supercontig / SO=protein_coding / is_pseudo=false